VGGLRWGVFQSPVSCLSDSEFSPGWKKFPAMAGTKIKAVLRLFGIGWANFKAVINQLLL
jgi:hypothetical protein